MPSIHHDAQTIIKNVIADNMPQSAVLDALTQHQFKENIYIVAIGKAAWTMAKAASDFLGSKLTKGIVITKCGHAQGDLPRMDIFEAGHPISDAHTIEATQKCIDLAKGLTVSDELLFLVSGGGSALFEKPLEGVSLTDIQDITNQLLSSGADIVAMNMVRKRLSAVKAGRFAALAAPAQIFSVVLSDVLGDRLDSIASGPAVSDISTVEDALRVIRKYNLNLSPVQMEYISQETPKDIQNVKTVVTGSVKILCESAARAASNLGYTPYILTTTMHCEASEAGRFLASIAADTQNSHNAFAKPCAIIAGGETVVTVKGRGKGGRNQEMALSAANGIAGLEDTVIFALGSDGTDGPTNAAGGIVDGNTVQKLKNAGIDIDKMLADNDAYHGLQAVDGLIITGPTGTNVNDVAVVLCRS